MKKPKVWIARIKLPRELQPVTREAAHKRGMTLQGVLEEALRAWLQKQQENAA